MGQNKNARPAAAPAAIPEKGRRGEWLCPLLLIGLTLLAYSPVWDCDFVNYDDTVYVTENPHVHLGLTGEGLKWGLTTLYNGNWHPLVWWSFELDSTLFGRNPAGFHTTSLLWHLGSVLLLYYALLRMTRMRWPSAVVAALFALHPLNVESVAWVSERKGVISTFFWMLTLWAYARYAEHPSVRRYLVVVGGLVLGLMAKPMLITLPFVLLLLDFWPLRRWQRGTNTTEARPPSTPWKRLVLEKAPLLGIAIAFSVLAYLAQDQAHALTHFQALPLSVRLGNVLVSYAWFLGHALYPEGLAVFYPCPMTDRPVGQVVGSALLLAGITVVVVWQVWRRPYLLVGWLWYVGTLVPVIGLVQIGVHTHADRYAYVPLVGIFIGLCWLAAEAVGRWQGQRVVGVMVGGMLALLMLSTWTQAQYWHDSRVLWEHDLQVAGPSAIAYNGLGVALASQDRDLGAKAADCFREALTLDPKDMKALTSLGVVLLQQGKLDEAADCFQKTLAFDGENIQAHNNLGIVRLRQQNSGKAAGHFREALRLDPLSAQIHYNLGRALRAQHDWEQAALHFGKAEALAPDIAEYRRSREAAQRHQER